MSSALIHDAEQHPELFDFKLPSTPPEIEALEHQLRVKLPPSYGDVLQALGQGSFFDNETLLGVHEADEGTGDIADINRQLHEKQGLAPELIVFHLGRHALHAFDTETTGPEYQVVELNEDTLARGEIYDGFEAWYEENIRIEYASILGLE